VKRWRCVLSIPGDTLYLRAQTAAAKAAADRLGMELEVISADMDPVAQGIQLLKFVQSQTGSRPDAIILEPVSAAGLPRVAEAAVAAGISWVVSNAQVDYLATLRKTAKVPVFQISQDHVEVGRIQGRQIAAILPDGGTALYLRGPAMSWWATKRFEGMEGTKPRNVEVKSLKIQGSTAEQVSSTVSSWLNLSKARPEGVQLIVSQNADFIFGARKAFETHASSMDRARWMAVPCAGVGVEDRIAPLVTKGELCAAVVTSLTMDKAVDMLGRALTDASQPREQTLVEARSYPAVEEIARKWKGVKV
jgi:ABC-type sugar transport system substrate-binding protein